MNFRAATCVRQACPPGRLAWQNTCRPLIVDARYSTRAPTAAANTAAEEETGLDLKSIIRQLLRDQQKDQARSQSSAVPLTQPPEDVRARVPTDVRKRGLLRRENVGVASSLLKKSRREDTGHETTKSSPVELNAAALAPPTTSFRRTRFPHNRHQARLGYKSRKYAQTHPVSDDINRDQQNKYGKNEPGKARFSDNAPQIRNTLGIPHGISKPSERSTFFDFKLVKLRSMTGSMGLYRMKMPKNYDRPGLGLASPMSRQTGPTHSAISKMWLRENCSCEQCVHPLTKQRLFDINKIPQSPEIIHGDVDDDMVNVTWDDGHESCYRKTWLNSSQDPFRLYADRVGYVPPIWWEEAKVRAEPPEVQYHAVMNTESGLAEWTRKINEVGFCFVEGCPATPEATKALLERIGPIRNTHYGEFWDFTSDLASKDMAYTDLALEPHTDTAYFSDPAGLQMFHLLEHVGQGGQTQLVDGFRIGLELYNKHRVSYDALSSTKTFFHSSGNHGISVQPDAPHPIFLHDSNTTLLKQVRWNPADRGAVFLPSGSDSMRNWYSATKIFDGHVRSDVPALRYEVQLKPGRPLIFNNWRVLHGRSAFTGKRRMCGGYINRDDFISRFKTSNYGYEEILSSGIY